MRAPAIVTLLAFGLFAASCDEADKGTVDGIAAAWQSSGLDASKLETIAITGLEAAEECRRGPMDGVEVSLCRFASAAAAEEARAAGMTVIGKNTGLALARGEFLLIVVDRDGADVDGKTINEIGRRFLDSAVAETSEEEEEESGETSPAEALFGKSK